MALEYIFDIIRATAGEDITVSAEIKNREGAPITEGCYFMLHEKEGEVIYMVEGVYDPNIGVWSFVIPAHITESLQGEYSYCIGWEGSSLCFRKPFYLV